MRLSPATWAGLAAILLIVGLAVTSTQGPAGSRWPGWRRQLRADAAHHALMEQQDTANLTPAKKAQLDHLRARFLQQGE